MVVSGGEREGASEHVSESERQRAAERESAREHESMRARERASARGREGGREKGEGGRDLSLVGEAAALFSSVVELRVRVAVLHLPPIPASLAPKQNRNTHTH
eukprot:1203220-Rhodomonas_salina.1